MYRDTVFSGTAEYPSPSFIVHNICDNYVIVNLTTAFKSF
jgi:hypothetical protein